MRALLLAVLFTLGGCGWIGFRRNVTDDEVRIYREVRSYYQEIQRAFAAGNAQALSSLFDASILKPMTKVDVEAWAEKFFRENGRARFKIAAIIIEDLGRERAVVRIKYEVTTPSGKGGFAGSERDFLIKRGGRWYTAEWEVLK